MLPPSMCGHLFWSTKLTSLWRQIEASDTPRPQPDNNELGLLPDRPEPQVMILREHKSIGQFYNELEQGKLLWSSESSLPTYSILLTGVKALPDRAFAHNADKQFSGMDFYDDQMVVITDQASALNALKTIIEQGEGDAAVEDSHYTIFVRLYSNRKAWKHYEVLKNPTTQGYKGRSTNDFVYKVGCLVLFFLTAYSHAPSFRNSSPLLLMRDIATSCRLSRGSGRLAGRQMKLCSACSSFETST
jgi:Ferritin-like